MAPPEQVVTPRSTGSKSGCGLDESVGLENLPRILEYKYPLATMKSRCPRNLQPTERKALTPSLLRFPVLRKPRPELDSPRVVVVVVQRSTAPRRACSASDRARVIHERLHALSIAFSLRRPSAEAATYSSLLQSLGHRRDRTPARARAEVQAEAAPIAVFSIAPEPSCCPSLAYAPADVNARAAAPAHTLFDALERRLERTGFGTLYLGFPSAPRPPLFFPPAATSTTHPLRRAAARASTDWEVRSSRVTEATAQSNYDNLTAKAEKGLIIQRAPLGGASRAHGLRLLGLGRVSMHTRRTSAARALRFRIYEDLFEDGEDEGEHGDASASSWATGTAVDNYPKLAKALDFFVLRLFVNFPIPVDFLRFSLPLIAFCFVVPLVLPLATPPLLPPPALLHSAPAFLSPIDTPPLSTPFSPLLSFPISSALLHFPAVKRKKEANDATQHLVPVGVAQNKTQPDQETNYTQSNFSACEPAVCEPCRPASLRAPCPSRAVSCQVVVVLFGPRFRIVRFTRVVTALLYAPCLDPRAASRASPYALHAPSSSVRVASTPLRLLSSSPGLVLPSIPSSHIANRTSASSPGSSPGGSSSSGSKTGSGPGNEVTGTGAAAGLRAPAFAVVVAMVLGGVGVGAPMRA
ncbi:hypothetical protein DFH09DRAFT_1355040 [Mycena vulgaris]|nr:hypothetical protein DFH09DRAFT_1355040 [Mycena vulgaris]